nr:GntR family transcriptional regulator [Modestobacter muralis]
MADLRLRLDAGEFIEGFPGEMDLVGQYQVSRHTIREALRSLRAEGVVSAGRGRRPRVATGALIEQPTGIVYSLFGSVESAGLRQESRVRKLDVRADALVAVRLGLEESTPLLYLERLRLAEGEPLALDRVWLPASVGEPLLGADFTHTSLYDQLMAMTGISVTGGEETVRAVIPTAAEHAVLNIEPPAAAFAVERTGTSHGVPIEWRHTLIRADRFALTSALAATPRNGTREDAVDKPLSLLPTYS